MYINIMKYINVNGDRLSSFVLD